MKSQDEQFDDMLKKKLEGLKIQPAADFFDRVVVPEKNKRPGFWFWFGSGLVLVAIVGFIFFMGVTPEKIADKSTDASNDSEQIHQDKNVVNGYSAIKKAQVINESQSAVTSQDKSDTENISHPDSYSTQNSSSGNTKSDKINSRIDTNTDNNSGSGNNYNSNYKPVPVTLSYQLSNEKQNPPLYYATLLSYTSGSSLPGPLTKLIKPDNLEFNTPEPSKWSFELFAGEVTSYSRLKSTPPDTLSDRMLESRKNAENPSMGIFATVGIKYSIRKKTGVYLAAGFTLQEENFEFNFNEYYQELQIDTIHYFILFPFAPPLPAMNIDSTIVNATKSHQLKHHIKTAHADISIGAYYSIPLGRFNIEPFGGLSLSMLAFTEGKSSFQKDFNEVSADKVYTRKINPGVRGGIQFGYNLNEKFNLFVNTSYTYQFINIIDGAQFYSRKSNEIRLGAGLSYRLFRHQAANVDLQGSDIAGKN